MQLDNEILMELKCPSKIREICILLKNAVPIMREQVIFRFVLAWLFLSFTHKRIKFNESGNEKLINAFILIIAPSGCGKDFLSDKLENFVFKEFFAYHKSRFIDSYTKLDENADKTNVGISIFANDTSHPGMYFLGELLQKIGYGSITIKIPEYFYFLAGKRRGATEFIHHMFEYYSCKIGSKIKHGKLFSPEISNLPLNLLAYSDSTPIEDNNNFKKFTSDLKTGGARRFDIGYQPFGTEFVPTFTDEEEIQLNQNLRQLGIELLEIYKMIPMNATYKLTPEAKKRLNIYFKELEKECNNEKDIIIKKSIKENVLRSLKLSCLFASLNHPQMLEITVEDAEQSVCVIEFLKNDIRDFIASILKPNDEYEKVFNLLKRNLNQEFSKTDLTSKYMLELGISRRNFVRSYDQILDAVNDIAIDRGYILKRTICRNSFKVALKKLDENYKSDGRLL